MKRSSFIFALTAIVAALAGALLARSVLRNSPPAPTLATGTVIEPPRPVPNFALIDQNEQRFAIERLRGKWSLLFFGFTNCGDVCPTTLTILASTVKSLADLPEALQPQVAFISVDSQRDTPAALQAYVKNFNTKFVGVTGTQKDLDAFTKALGVPSAIRQLENGSYAVDHSQAILAINPQGEWRALFSPPHSAASLANDYRVLAGLAQ